MLLMLVVVVGMMSGEEEEGDDGDGMAGKRCDDEQSALAVERTTEESPRAEY